MKDLVKSIERAVEEGHLLSGIITALTVPDVAVAAMNLDNHTNGPRYAAWVDRWFHQQLPHYREAFSLDGTTLYAIRCTLLSQGMATPARSMARPRGNRAVVKRQLCFTSENVNNRALDLGGILTICINAREFSLGMAGAGRAWLAQSDHSVQSRVHSLVEVRNGTQQIDPETVVVCVDY